MKKSEYLKFAKETKKAIKEANIILPKEAEIDIADFGLGEFKKTGIGLYTKINEPEYCSKWIVIFPNQTCPTHKHRNKKETFIVIRGNVEVRLNEKIFVLKPGEKLTVEKGTYHSFTSKKGAIVEEISTFDSNSDNYFIDNRIIRDTVIE